ncbi:MAG TPA: hypothetical protein VJR92_09880 [Gemmatimonadaceae bacterium]|nr:hypothetical protein [Gemmatimonadaceae bacterium]
MHPDRVRWLTPAACAWTVVFGAPHVWWALGIPAGFPGGRESYEFFMSSTWRYVYDLVVVALCVLAFVIARILDAPTPKRAARRLSYIGAWIASGMLSLRGVAGMIVDRTSDLIWWPLFLTGGLLFAGVAWRARTRNAL